MKKKLITLIEDCFVGLGMGCGVIIPGVAAPTIALITNRYEKIVKAVSELFSKKFFRSLLILLPFAIFALLAVVLLIDPITYVLDTCLFVILALFAGFIAGSIPGVTDEVKNEKISLLKIVVLLVGFALVAFLGVFAIKLDFSTFISNIFSRQDFLLYLVLFVVGIISSAGLAIPGFSGSLLLLVLGFYEPILNVAQTALEFESNFWTQISLLLSYGIGVVIGFILLSKLMNNLIKNHKHSTYYFIIGLLAGSLISIFINPNTFSYVANGQFSLLDTVLTPVSFGVGFLISYLFVNIVRDKQK